MSELTFSLEQLLISQAEPQIVSIKGSWGTGKTHFWKRFAEDHEDHQTAYVSLFGQNDLKSLRQAISVALMPDDVSVVKKYLPSAIRWLEGFRIKGFGLPGDLVAEFVLERMLKNAGTICLDDFERATVDHEVLLGFINNLRDENRVNVVLIYNEEKLSDDDPYYKYREKVIDRELPYRPKISEVVDIAIENPDLRQHVLEHCKVLELTNIRVLRRIMQYYDELAESIDGDQRDAILKQGLHSLILYGYITFCGTGLIRDLDELRDYSQIGSDIRLHAQAEKNNRGGGNVSAADEAEMKRLQDRNLLLGTYSYDSTDSLDRVLIDFVENGYLDNESLRSAIAEVEAGHGKQEKEKLLGQIWEKFNHSFADNQDELIAEIVEVTNSHAGSLALMDYDNLIWLLDRLGKTDEKDHLLDLFRENFTDKITINTDPYDLRVSSPDLKSVIDEIQANIKDPRSLGEILRAVLLTDSWASKDVDKLAAYSVDDYEEFFESSSGSPLGTLAKEVSRIARRYSNPTDAQIEVERKATEALKRIAEKSDYNRARVERYVNLEIEGPNDTEQS